jgi:hypothetical protein
MGLDAALPPGLPERIRKMIRDEVGRLLRSDLLRSASIGEGGLTIKGGFLRALPLDEAAAVSFYVGRIVSAVDGSYQGTGVLLQQPDGTDIAVIRTAEGDFGPGKSIVSLRDSGERVVFATDAASGQGMARPYVPGGFYRQRSADWSVSTTAGAFEGLWKAEMPKQQPRLRVATQAATTASDTTGEIRVMVNGVQMGAVAAIGSGPTISAYGPEAVAGDHMSTLTVEIQGRRTAGTGSLRVEPLRLEGRQS